MDQATSDLAGLSLDLFLFESIDELDGGEEADPLVMVLDRLDAERRGDVGFAGAGTSDQDDIVSILEERAAMELADERLIDFAAGKVEAVEIAIGREAGCLELIGRRADLPLCHLGFEELGQDRHGGFGSRRALLGQVPDGLCHAEHLEAGQHDHKRAAGRVMTHDAPPLPGAERRSARH